MPDAMLLLRSLAVWLVLMVVETIHGIARTLWLVPRVGDLRARQVGVFSGSVLLLGVAAVAAPWLRADTPPRQFGVGSLWVALTLLFEIGVGRLVLRLSWDRLASDYDVRKGGLMPLGLVALLLAPWIGARLAGPSHH
jgi:hypothetical protein